MDLSIVAVVGSFLVSERVLGPKTFIAVLLGGLLSYDLMTKTHDPASLRIYRGPGLLAFTLMCSALSLRVWRRNGICCDELLFLPGTKHGAKHSTSTTEHFRKRMSPQQLQNSNNNNNNNNNNARNEGQSNDSNNNDTSAALTSSSQQLIESIDDALESMSSFDNENTYQQEGLEMTPALSIPPSNSLESEGGSSSIFRRVNSKTNIIDDEILLSSSDNHTNIIDNSNNNNTGGDNDDERSELLSTESWETDGDSHYAYAPSATRVLGGGLDLMIPVLFNFHLFTEATAHATGQENEPSPKILPLVFLVICIFRAIIPFGSRYRFWCTLRYTIMAPCYSVSFRDAFVGDVLTSLVRLIQDFSFAVFYIIYIIRGLVTHSYKLDDVGDLLETNPYLHNIVLPSCAILPLWFKYIQCLRQIYDTKKRWPHLGNAFKYLTAALIILHAMVYPQNRRGKWWDLAFVVCTIYQIYWDTMEWELFVYRRSSSSSNNTTESVNTNTLCNKFFSLRIQDLFHIPTIKQNIHNFFSNIELRPHRLYKHDFMYWRIFWINCALRFCWMLNFIPAHHISSIDGELVRTFSSDMHGYLGPIISGLEVIRRCLWGLLRLEIETIKITNLAAYSDTSNNAGLEEEEIEGRKNGDLSSMGLPLDHDADDSEENIVDTEMQKMIPSSNNDNNNVQHDVNSQNNIRRARMLRLKILAKNAIFSNTMLMIELSVWASAFFTLGYIVVYRI